MNDRRLRETGVWQTVDGRIVVRSVSGVAPWAWRSQDGADVGYHQELPSDAVQLVRADEAKAVAEWLMHELLWSALGYASCAPWSRDAYDLAVRVLKAEAGADRLAAQCDALIAERDDPYSQVNQDSSAWSAIKAHPLIGPISSLPQSDTYAAMVLAKLDAVHRNLVGIPPEATNPAHLRFAATVIEQTAVPVEHGGDGDNQERTARELRTEADRIEGKVAADALIEKAARLLVAVDAEDWDCLRDGDDARRDALLRARKLHDAGLLREDGAA